MYRTSLRWLATYYVPTPFDHQPVAIPTVRPYADVIADIAPPGELSRKDEVHLLLKGLPKACDEAKEAVLMGKRASRYYRTRYGRGAEAQRKHAKTILSLENPMDVKAWAQARCVRVNNPLEP